jgi:hypothetical protein
VGFDIKAKYMYILYKPQKTKILQGLYNPYAAFFDQNKNKNLTRFKLTKKSER